MNQLETAIFLSVAPYSLVSDSFRTELQLA